MTNFEAYKPVIAVHAVDTMKTKQARFLVRPPRDHKPDCSSTEPEKVQNI